MSKFLFVFTVIISLGVILYPLCIKAPEDPFIVMAPIPVEAEHTLAEVKPPEVEEIEPVISQNTIVDVIVQGWVIRVGTFSVQQNAEKLVKKLKNDGLPVYTKTVSYSGKNLTLVMVGPHADKETADLKRTEIEKHYGLKGQLLKESKA